MKSRTTTLARTTLAAVLALSLGVGCADDPYSQRRIQRRQAHLQQTANDIEKHEAGGNERLKYRINDFNRKMQQDEMRCNDRFRRVGDYVW